MIRLVQKCGYIRQGNVAGYLKYIATRERVQKLDGNGPATAKQRQLIDRLLRDFPDSDELFEYMDYMDNPTLENASAFIAAALDINAHTFQEGDVYMKYIATRPRVERTNDHGLFGQADSISLDRAMDEVAGHKGNVWTLIWSLRRGDAQQLGYDKAANWRQLVRSHQMEIAKAMKIPPDQLHWYAAFHDEGHHPHVHVMVWSADPKQGYLTRNGIKAMRSTMTNAIFQDELYTLYQQKDVSYKEVTAAARRKMTALVERMNSGIYDSPSIAEKMIALSKSLESVSGRKVYGYLPKSVKAQVDTIVDELAQLPEVAEYYATWNQLRDELEGFYKEKPRQHLPLSQQKEFKAIKNAVIQEAERLRVETLSFEDKDMDDEPEVEPPASIPSAPRRIFQMAQEYRVAKAILADGERSQDEKERAVSNLERLFDEGFTVAAHQLGKVWRDGLCGLSDEVKAEEWFHRSAEAGHDYSQYALGKLLQGQGRIPEALEWYGKADMQGNQYARYRLGKLYLLGEDVPKDVPAAILYLEDSAAQGNQYAQYTLGKLFLQGQEVEQDKEAAKKWLTLSAEQGNPYAQFFLDRFDQYRDPSIALCVTRLLHHASKIFQETPLPANPIGVRIDSKRRKTLLAKRLAMGHKIDDHDFNSVLPISH